MSVGAFSAIGLIATIVRDQGFSYFVLNPCLDCSHIIGG